jgi:tRNA(fMet)-specific endonuclease VapC
MSQLYLLDTNTVSYLMSGRSPAARRAFDLALEHGRLAISSLSEAELLFGLQQRPNAIRLREAYSFFRLAVDVLAWDSPAAAAYARLVRHLKTSGKSMTTIDLLLAAQALSLDCTFVTSDRAFQHTGGLISLENWATDL